jgi:hypothetical protein
MEKKIAASDAAMRAEEGRAAATEPQAQAQEAKARAGTRPLQGVSQGMSQGMSVVQGQVLGFRL